MDENKLALKKEQGKRLRIARDCYGITQEEFAIKCGKKKQHIKDCETGVVEIKLFFALKIEREYGINHDWLLAGQGDMIKKGEGKMVPMEEHMKLLKEHVVCLKELNEAHKWINRLTAPSGGAADDAG